MGAETGPTAVVISQRRLRTELSRCYSYEIEDLAAELLDAEVVAPGFRGRAALGSAYEKVVRASAYWSGGRAVVPGRPGLRGDAFTPVDFAYVHVQFPRDLSLLEALPGWRGRVGAAVCFVEEMWLADLDRLAGYRRWLEQFDRVYVGLGETARALDDRIDTPVSYLPYSVDALAFAPRTPGGRRGIDVINIGRRSPVTHEALVRWSADTGRFYYFDSFRPKEVKDPAEHRFLLGSLMRNSRIAVANRGVGADPARTGEQHALPARCFEAAAPGAVLVGATPEVDELEAVFGWEDAIIEMPFDSPDAPEIVEALLADETRLESASRRNVVASLTRHDHVHRLATMLDDVGLAPPRSFAERSTALESRAEAFRD